MSRSVFATMGLLPAMCTGLIACASSQPVQAAKADFNGVWSVKWCDKSNPKLDCGGFNVTLAQKGERICGDFGGALVNLRQTDEGTIVGAAIGKTAVLTVRSQRSQAILLIRVELNDDTLSWRAVDTVQRGEGDIDVIASNDVLTRTPSTASTPKQSQETAPNCFTDQ